MNKSLGEYVRLIPREDQDTMVCALLPKRTGFHRGMLAFVPIEELKLALRPKPNDDYQLQMAKFQLAQQQAIQQLQQKAAQNQWYTQGAQGIVTSGTTTVSGLSGLGGGMGVCYPNQSISGSSYSIPAPEVPQTYLFAYAALLAAINAMPGALDYHEPVEEEQLEACEA